MICGLRIKLYDLDEDSDGVVVSSMGSGLEMETLEKAAAEAPSAPLVAHVSTS